MKLDTLADPPVMIGASLATAVLLARRAPVDAARFAVAVPVAAGITKLLKLAIDEHRPRLFDRRPEQSFPSGHSAAVTAFTVSAVAASRRWWLIPVAAAAIAAIDIARVREREHWPRDVLAGDAIGLVGAVAGAAAAYVTARSADRARRRGSAAG